MLNGHVTAASTQQLGTFIGKPLLNLGLLRLVMASTVAKDHTDIDCDITKFRLNSNRVSRVT